MTDKYLNVLKLDAEETKAYLRKSLGAKTQQQLRIEEILERLRLAPQRIADVACGSGSLSFHLSSLYPQARFTLADLNDDALDIAREVGKTFNAGVVKADAHALSLPSDHYDLVFFWHTLLCVNEPQRAFRELLRICQPGGRVFISSLFNMEHDVDLLTKAVDHTRASSREGGLPYNSFCERTIRSWTDCDLAFHDCEMQIDLPQQTRGLGTYTRKLEGGRRLQISAGMIMSWRILEVRKTSGTPEA